MNTLIIYAVTVLPYITMFVVNAVVTEGEERKWYTNLNLSIVSILLILVFLPLVVIWYITPDYIQDYIIGNMYIGGILNQYAFGIHEFQISERQEDLKEMIWKIENHVPFSQKTNMSFKFKTQLNDIIKIHIVGKNVFISKNKI